MVCVGKTERYNKERGCAPTSDPVEASDPARSTLWAGLDTGADISYLSVIDQDLRPCLEIPVPSDPAAISAAFQTLSGSIIEEVAMEATSTSLHIAHGLRDRGFKVSLLHASQASRYLKLWRNKTDKNDARGLAELARLRPPTVKRVFLKSPQIQRIRAKLLFRDRLTGQRVACEAMIRAFLRVNGGCLKRSQSSKALVRHVTEQAARLRQAKGIDIADDIKPLVDLSVSIRLVVSRIDDELAAWVQANPVCARFLDIPGVGAVTAISFYTAVEDPWRFKKENDIGAYLGLTPKVLQSGVSVRHGRINKMGSTLTRKHLVGSATVMFSSRTRDCPLKEWGLILAERAGRPKARIAIARRLAVMMLAIWKSGRAYDPDLARARVRASSVAPMAGNECDPVVGLEALTSPSALGRSIEPAGSTGPDFENRVEARPRLLQRSRTLPHKDRIAD